MKLKVCFLFFLLIVVIILSINTLVRVPSLVDLLIGMINKDAISTKATVINKDVNKNVTISFLTDRGYVDVTYHNDLANSIAKKGAVLPIYYSKKMPTKIYKFDIIMFLNIFMIYGIYFIIFRLPFFYDILSKFRSKKWLNKNYNFEDMELLNGDWYTIMVSYEENGKKKIESILCPSLLIKYLIENKAIDKVPVLVHPTSSKKCIDYDKIDKLVNVHKALIHFSK